MNIKLWKQFSDLVDKHNKKMNEIAAQEQIEADKRNELHRNEMLSQGIRPILFAGGICFPRNLINKTR